MQHGLVQTALVCVLALCGIFCFIHAGSDQALPAREFGDAWGQFDRPRVLSVSPRGHVFLFGVKGRELQAWDSARAKLLWTRTLPTTITSARWTADQELIGVLAGTVGDESSLLFLDAATGADVWQPNAKFKNVISWDLSVDGLHFAVIDDGGGLHVWHRADQKELWNRPLLTDPVRGIVVRSIVWSKDGSYLAVGVGDKVQFIDAVTGKSLGILPLQTPARPERFTFSPKGNILIIAFTRHVECYDAKAKTLIARFDTDTWPHAEISSCQRYLAAGGATKVHIWDLQTKQRIAEVEGQGPIAFTPDSSTLIGSHPTRKLLLWDLKKLTTLKP